MVQNIEELRAELKRRLLLQPEVLECREIQVLHGRSEHCIAPYISQRIQGLSDERGKIKPLVGSLRRAVRISNYDRPVSTARIGSGGRVLYRESLARLNRGDGIHLPASQECAR